MEDDRTDGGMREFYRLHCITRRERGLPPDSVEAKRLTVEVLAKNGIKLTN